MNDYSEALEKYMPYLLEIRRRLFFTFSLFAIGSIIGFMYADKIVSSILSLFNLKGVNVVFTSPFQFINLSFSISFLTGVIIAFPLIIIQTLSFLRPALNKKEFKIVLYLLPFSIILFLGGTGFGFLVTKYMVSVFYDQALNFNVGNFLDISSLLAQLITISVLMGIAFQFPIVITVLLRLKIIKHDLLTKIRIWFYAGALIFAGLLPPTDVLSTVIYFLALALLYEITLILNRLAFGK